MNQRCPYCQALYFKEEANNNGYNKCCKKGRINFIFEDDKPYPEPLFQMMVNPRNEYHGDFHENIRIINNNYGFISTKAGFIGNVNKRLNPNGNSRGVPIVRIDGALYHLFSDRSFPENEEVASHSHLYVIDQEAADLIRSQRGDPRKRKKL